MASITLPFSNQNVGLANAIIKDSNSEDIAVMMDKQNITITGKKIVCLRSAIKEAVGKELVDQTVLQLRTENVLKGVDSKVLQMRTENMWNSLILNAHGAMTTSDDKIVLEDHGLDIISARVPANVKRAMIERCENEGTTMSSKLADLVHQYLSA